MSAGLRLVLRCATSATLAVHRGIGGHHHRLFHLQRDLLLDLFEEAR